MRFVIVTGMSGAGKSVTLKMLEDMGYYCVDNLPIPLVGKFVELLSIPNQEISKVALGVDIRSGEVSKIEDLIDRFSEEKQEYEVLFLDATDEVLVKDIKRQDEIIPLAGERELTAALQKRENFWKTLRRNQTIFLIQAVC